MSGKSFSPGFAGRRPGKAGKKFWSRFLRRSLKKLELERTTTSTTGTASDSSNGVIVGS